MTSTPAFPEGVFQPVHVEDDPEPQPVPLQQYFFEESAPPSRRNVARSRCMTSLICHFDERGQHTFMSPACPHFSTDDETGQRTRPEWTVQG
jgi:hypothetical protein